MMYRRSNRQRLALAALLAATATLVTLDFRGGASGPLRSIQDAAMSVVAPLQSGVGQVFGPVGEVFSTVSKLGTLKSENAELRREIKALQGQQTRFPEILRENRRLKTLTAQKDWVQGRTIGAKVIGVGPSNQESTVFLDKGSSHGLKEDMAVVSSEGLVGRVVLAGESYSKVLLAIDPQHAAGARLTQSSETGVVSGRSSEDLKFDLIDPATKIAKGETVVTSGYDRGIYPSGIPIGRVTRSRTAPDGLSKSASVRPFVKFSRLDTVLVLLDSGSLVKTPAG